MGKDFQCRDEGVMRVDVCVLFLVREKALDFFIDALVLVHAPFKLSLLNSYYILVY